MSIEKLRILSETTFAEFPDESIKRFVEDAVKEYDELKKNETKLKGQIKEAVICVHNSHEYDIGYDVLCSLGEEP